MGTRSNRCAAEPIFSRGDNVGCVGCHEPKGQITRPISVLPKAFKRPPSKLQPGLAGSRAANFPELVQPVLDKYCVDCHDEESMQEKTFSLVREPYVRGLYQSYYNLMKNGYEFYDYGNALRTEPGRFGASKAKLLPLLNPKRGKRNFKASESTRPWSRVLLQDWARYPRRVPASYCGFSASGEKALSMLNHPFPRSGNRT